MRTRLVTVLVATWGASLLVTATAALGQKRETDSVWAIPEGVVAYLACDGGKLGPRAERERALVAGALRGVVANTVSIEGASGVADTVLRAAVLEDAPYRVCLLELKGQAGQVRAGKRGAMTPEAFGAVIEIFSPASSHERLRAAVERGVLADAMNDGDKARYRRDISLPGGVTGKASGTGEAWREVSWVSLPRSFVIGFGEGTLGRWSEAAPARGAEWWSHGILVWRKRGRGERVLEAFVDLNALRRGVPDEFDGGRLGEILRVWGMANARSFMVHASVVPLERKEEQDEKPGPGVLAVDFSWSSRAEAPSVVRSMSVTESGWPEGLSGKPEGTDWAMVVRTDVRSWIDLAMGTYLALSADEGFGAERRRWERRAGPALQRILPRLAGWTVMRPGLEVRIGVKEVRGPDRLAADLRPVFSQMGPVKSSRLGWEMDVEAEAALRGLSWRLEGNAIVTEWRE